MDESISLSRARISRRRALGAAGTIGLGALLAACDPATVPAPTVPASTGVPQLPQPSTTSTPDLVGRLDAAHSCRLTTEEMDGPYWFDVDSIRSDIREGRPGTPLKLALRVQDHSCAPVANSVVEIWHCDAGGVYSGYEVSSRSGTFDWPPVTELSDGQYSSGDVETKPADDGTYLRGAQVADGNGIVQFTTIWPGWYRGRTVHIHVKVHINKSTVLTSQLYFDDALNDKVFSAEPYSLHPGQDTRNAADQLIDATGLLTVEPESEGYLAWANLGT